MKKKNRITEKQISKAQAGMRALGVFHYALAGFLLVLIVLLIAAGPERLGEAIHRQGSDALASLNRYDDEVAGVTAIGLLLIQFGIEVYLGWSTRRKANRPDKMLIKLILSGGSVLMTLFSVIRSGFSGAELGGLLYTLGLNLITFLLALRIRNTYQRLRRERAGGTEAGDGSSAGDSGAMGAGA